MTEIKPCPVCGGEADFYDEPHSFVVCKNLKCLVSGPLSCDEEEAIEMWNNLQYLRGDHDRT